MAAAQQMSNGAAPWLNAILDGPPSIAAGDNIVSNPAASVVKPGFFFNFNGGIGRTGGSVSVVIGNWWSMGNDSLFIPVVPPASEFYIRATLLSGVAPTAGTMNTWLQLSTTRAWSNNVARTSQILFDIAADSAGNFWRASGVFTITAT